MNKRHFRFPTFRSFAQIPMYRQKWRMLAYIFLGVLVAPVLAIAVGTMSAGEVAVTLGNLTNYNRSNAIAAMARNGQIRSPLSGADGAAILQGVTGASRTYGISELAALFKTDLNGQEAEAILGPENTLSNYDRSNAIAALARAKRFGPSLGEDAELALKGAAGASRTHAISEISPYLRTDLPGQAIATILGSGDILSNYDRSNAIAALARAGKMRACMSGDEMNLILSGATGASRTYAIAEIANAAKPQCVAPVSTGATKPVASPPEPSSVPIGGSPAPSTTAGTTPTTVGTLGSFTATVHCKYSATKKTQLDIRWSSSNGASTYEVFRDGVSVSSQLAKNVRTFSDLNVPLGKRSVYSVRASNGQESITGNANAKGAGIGSVNTDGNSEVYCFLEEEIETATANVQYAIFSNNAYQYEPKTAKTKEKYPRIAYPRFTRWILISESGGYQAMAGFYAQAYIEPTTKLAVIVFRGTDEAIDWMSNLTLISPQYIQAEQFTDSVYKLLPKEVKTVVFTGHSLGGGLAQYAAKKFIDRKLISDVKTVVFDSSPRTGILLGSTPNGTIFISAAGEVLHYASLGNILRPVGTRLDFLKGNLLDKHSITELACGLVYAAAAKNENVWSTVAKKCDEVSAVRWWVK